MHLKKIKKNKSALQNKFPGRNLNSVFINLYDSCHLFSTTTRRHTTAPKPETRPGRFHLRMRNICSSFPALEWKSQDGPSAALLESPKKIRPGVSILVSFPSISSLWKAPSLWLTFKTFVATEIKDFVTERAPPHGGDSQTNMAVSDVPRSIHSISIFLSVGVRW